MPFKDSKGKMRKSNTYFIEPGKSMSERELKEKLSLNENVYTATFDNDFGTFIDDLATVIGADYALYPGAPETGLPIEISPRDFNAWDEFGYEKHWNRIPDGQPFKITGNTPGMVEAPSLKNYTFIKMGNVIKGKV
tara:strand:+ start:562 stop:969 length:408 start_codon:yes stop_codon:yes gene_type:complete